MTLLEAIVLAVIQGLTEFLPISSTAHLRIVPALVGWSDPGSAFSAVIQIGTLAAVLTYFWRDVLRILTAMLADLAGERMTVRAGDRVRYSNLKVDGPFRFSRGNVDSFDRWCEDRFEELSRIARDRNDDRLVGAPLAALAVALTWVTSHEQLGAGECVEVADVALVNLGVANVVAVGRAREGPHIVGPLHTEAGLSKRQIRTAASREQRHRRRAARGIPTRVRRRGSGMSSASRAS